MTSPIDSPWMKVPEVATHARSSRTEVLTALADGSLRGYQIKVGGTWRVHRDDVDSWIRGEEPSSSPLRASSPAIGRRAS